MFTRSALLRARVVAGIVFFAGMMTLGLACGTSSHANAHSADVRSAVNTVLSAGGDDTCAVLPNHRIECWGEADFGQLGNGTTINSLTPVQMRGITNATQVSASGTDTCVLLFNHTVECSGYNHESQLGNGKKTDSSTPVPVSGVTNATQVSAGFDHTCALLSNHTVKCWGPNYGGELGNGKKAGGSTPVPVKGITNATQISASDLHTCALLSNHTVKCWGTNDSGQLGNGSWDRIPHSTPLKVKGITNATQVSASTSYTCALLSNHSVECWGDNSDGQLGNGSWDSAPHPIPAEVKGITNATQVSAGGVQTCALLSNHTVKCWGLNGSGQLGDGVKNHGFKDSYGFDMSPTPVQVRGITNATEVSSGGGHTCARLVNHRVECWGTNAYGELGNDKTTNSSIPVTVVGLR